MNAKSRYLGDGSRDGCLYVFYGFRLISFCNEPNRMGMPKFDSINAITQTNVPIEEVEFLQDVHQFPVMTMYHHTFGRPLTQFISSLNHFML